MSKPPARLVSIVIPSFNSEQLLEKCLRSVREQTYPNIEIVVVDKYSTDRTREIAEELGARVVLCKEIRSKARNVGAGIADGEFVFSVDSDMELTPEVVSECIAEADEGFDALIIPEISVGEGFWVDCRALEKFCYIGDDLIEAARFFRKNVLECLGGYDSELEFGEDWDLNQRIRKGGYRIGRINAFIEHHEDGLSLHATMLKKFHYGKTLNRYRAKHPEEARRQLVMIRFAFFRNRGKLIRDPVHALGMLLMKNCEFLAGFLGSL